MNAHSFHFIYLTKREVSVCHEFAPEQDILDVDDVQVSKLASFLLGILCNNYPGVPTQLNHRSLGVVLAKYLLSFLFIDSYLVC